MKVILIAGCVVVAAVGLACSSKQDSFQALRDSAGDQSVGGAKTDAPSSGGGQALGGQGGDAASLAALGVICAQNSECDSGHCVDGVCCENACDGSCQECGSDGLCNVTSAVDLEACGTLSCPEDSECQSWSGGLEAGACADFGVCAEEHGCDPAPATRGSACGTMVDGKVCDGDGTCDFPELSCGDLSCTADGTEFCCFSRNGSGPTQKSTFACVETTELCTTNANLGWRAKRISCLGSRDCEGAEVCCEEVPPVNAGTDTVSCRAAGQCSAGNLVCDRNADCPTGYECKEATSANGPVRRCGVI